MRPLRPLFHRHASKDELAEQAERLKNRDWVEILRVVHPSQAESAEREYLIARLRTDWPELAGKLLSTHSIVASISGRNLLVLCDHNTFANELAMLAIPIGKKMESRYGVNLKITARASQRLDWEKAKGSALAEVQVTAEGGEKTSKSKEKTVIDQLIAQLEKLTF
jgi:hypothetical protein